jgi:hypothetical protein
MSVIPNSQRYEVKPYAAFLFRGSGGEGIKKQYTRKIYMLNLLTGNL